MLHTLSLLFKLKTIFFYNSLKTMEDDIDIKLWKSMEELLLLKLNINGSIL